MKTVVAIVHPGDNLHQVTVYKDSIDILEQQQVAIENIPATVMSLTEKYDVRYVLFKGIYQFNKKIIDNIQQQEMLRYNKKQLIIYNL